MCFYCEKLKIISKGRRKQDRKDKARENEQKGWLLYAFLVLLLSFKKLKFYSFLYINYKVFLRTHFTDITKTKWKKIHTL